mmetsp:Transcript_34631/g.98592  ORF Transcript_34631/g.98592 Transcript_34631/m.98592 type:complete len:257 (-) Transcript_34631:252-1022(-)
MARGKTPEPVMPADPTAWILDNGFAEFVLMHTSEIKYMVMLGYTFLHGCKVFKAVGPKAPFSYRFIYMVMACTGGGIIVPLLINSIPVPLSTDAYPIAIFTSYMIHTYAPVLREVIEISPVFKAAIVFLYETMRAFVVTKMTLAAAKAIEPSDFSFAVFGPIFCGTLGGCGGAFMPLSKGLDPIKEGLAPPMFSAFVAATFFHLFTTLATDVVYVEKKGKVMVALFFIAYGMYVNGVFKSATPAKKGKVDAAKKEK